MKTKKYTLSNSKAISALNTIWVVSIGFLIKACGGGGGSAQTPDDNLISDPSSGYVLDGYIAGARVYRDVNENQTFDDGEPYVLSDDNGRFENLGGDSTKPLIAYNHSGDATDIDSGIKLSGQLIAPAHYEFITPTSTLIYSLVQTQNLSLRGSEQVIISNLDLTDDLDFSTFNPLSAVNIQSETVASDALTVQLFSMKLNTLMSMTESNALLDQNDLLTFLSESATNGTIDLRSLTESSQFVEFFTDNFEADLYDDFKDMDTVTNLENAVINQIKINDALSQIIQQNENEHQNDDDTLETNVDNVEEGQTSNQSSVDGPINPLYILELSEADNIITYGIFIDPEKLHNSYSVTLNQGASQLPGVRDIFTKIAFDEGAVSQIGLTDFELTTAGRLTTELKFANQFWRGGVTEGISGSPQILQGYWDQLAAENIYQEPWVGEDGEQYYISTIADTDFRDPWITFTASPNNMNSSITFRLIDTSIDNEVVVDAAFTI